MRGDRRDSYRQAMTTDQVWTLEHEGSTHRVEAGGSARHHVRWFVDGDLLAEKKELADKVTVKPEDDDAGQLVVRFSGTGAPRRATLYGADEDAQAATGLGGVDLVPEEGSKAAAYEDKIREHPTRYALIATAGGVAKVVVPILVGLLVVRFAVNLPWSDWNLPDLPSIPTPDLPSIPWPSIPWPDLPDVSVPGWVQWLLDKVKYVWPVVLAYVLARAEIKRRRQQDERRQQQGSEDRLQD